MGATIQNSLLKGFFLLVIFVCHNSQAQFHHGLELGMNMTNADFMIGESAEPSNSFGFLIGYVAERDFSDNLYIRFGANYNRREFKAISRRGINTSNETWGIDVIEVPINLGYYLNWNNRNYQFFIDAGMNLGYNSRAFTKTEDETIRLDIGGDSDISRITIGANAGAGLLIKRRIKVRLNYYTSLTDIVTNEEDTWKNKTFGLSLNYFFKEKLDY
jgi:hypothetical protein